MLFHKATPEVGNNIKAQPAEQVISYASRTLSVAERKTIQLIERRLEQLRAMIPLYTANHL